MLIGRYEAGRYRRLTEVSVTGTLLMVAACTATGMVSAQTLNIPANRWVVVNPTYTGAPDGGYIFPQGWGNKGTYDPVTKRVIISDRWVDPIRGSSIFANGIYAYDPFTNIFTVLKLNNWYVKPVTCSNGQTGCYQTTPLASNTTDPTPPDHHPLTSLEVVPNQNAVYVVNGVNSISLPDLSILNTTWRLSLSTLTWQKVSDQSDPNYPPNNGGSPSGLIYDPPTDRLAYLVPSACGCSGTATYLFDPHTNQWEAPDLALSAHSVYVAGAGVAYDSRRSRIVAFGGNNFITAADGTRHLWAYSVAQNTWTQLADAPVAAMAPGFAYDSLNDVFLALVGNKTYLYNPNTNAWTEYPATLNRPIGLQTWQGVTYDPSHAAFVFEGGSFDQPLMALFKYQPNLPAPVILDTTFPVISIVSPANGSTVSGNVLLTANATDVADPGTTDPLGVVGVQFQLDGTILGAPVGGPGPAYSISWNASITSSGPHTLSATAMDSAGNKTTTSITVSVANRGTPPVISGIFVNAISSSTAAINWTTDIPSNSQVFFGTTTAYGSSSALLPTLTTSHSVTLSGIAPGTTYHCQLWSRDAQGDISASGDIIFSTEPALPPLIQIRAESSELSGSANGSTVTPSIAPPGFTGKLQKTGAGSLTFTPAQNGTGVFFTNCCDSTNSAYYKFTGPTIGNIFNVNQGQISFYLKSRYSFADRLANATGPRFAFDVRDNDQNNHLFYFSTRPITGSLAFTYGVAGLSNYYYVPPGTEEALLGDGVTLKVLLTWDASGINLFLNDVLAQTSPYAKPSPNWTAASNFAFGAYEYVNLGGWDVSDDVIDEFTVMGPAIDLVLPTVSLTAPVAGSTLSGAVSIAAAATDNVGISGVQFQLDGVNFGPTITGAGPNFGTVWDTTGGTNGAHSLSVIASDIAGNTATATTSVSVNNPSVPPIISSIAATSLTSTGVTIGWITDKATDAQVRYGTTTGYGITTPLNSTLSTSHSVKLQALAASTTYHYQVLSRDAQGNLASSLDMAFTTAAPVEGPAPVLQLMTEISEVTGTTDGAIVIPAITPPGFTGRVVRKGTGLVNFVPTQNGGGVYFQTCCDTANPAYFKFTGVPVGNIFNADQGQVSFFLKSRYSFAQRQSSAATSRFAFDVRDDDVNNHLFYFYTQVSSGYLLFSYRTAGKAAQFYFTPKGTEDALFGNGSILKVSITWDGSVCKLYFNDTLVQSSSYVKVVPNWTSASNFNLGAYEYSTLGGSNVLDDVIDEFTVLAPPTTPDTTPPTVSISSPAPGASLSGTVSVSINASDSVSLATVQVKLDGSNIGPALTGAGPSFSYSWNTASVANGSHSLSVVATDSAGNSTSSTPISVSVNNDSIPPTVSISSPAPGASLSGSVSVSVNASDNISLASVQLKLDGSNLGPALTGSGPSFSYSWNTASASNGSHSLTAVATDSAGNSASSSPVSVSISNIVPPPVISAVTALPISSTTATISWSTDTPADSQVAFGLALPYSSLSPLSTSLSTSHSLTLSSLSPSSLYHFQVLSRDSSGNLSSSSDFSFSTSAPPVGPQPLLLLSGEASELASSSNGALVSPSIAPPGFSGSLVKKANGSVTFSPAQSGNGVYFQSCCDNSNTAYYKFSGSSLANIFNVNQGQISFFLKSRFSFAQRQASASASRFAFDVRDADSNNHLFYFYTQVSSGYLLFSYRAGGTASQFYFTPKGTEDALFGNGSILKVSISWDGSTSKLFFNDTLVQSSSYTKAVPNWTSASNFDLGAYEYSSLGGYNVLDDIIDEFSVFGTPPSDVTPPTVSISSPAPGASLSGSASISINASDNISLASVQLKLDGSNLGPTLTGSGPSFSYSWNTASASNGTHSLTAVATDSAGNSASSAPVSVSVGNDSTLPAVSISSPTAGTSLSGSVSVSINASDNISLASVQLKLDGSNLGPALTGPGPSFSYSWSTASATDGPHTLTAIATDSAGNSASSAPVSVSVSNDSTPPTVSISSPTTGTSLSGTVSVSINASDNLSLASVQLKLDGSNLGSALTGSGPSFSYSWNTISATDGPHTLTAVATDSAGNSASSAPVSISVSNDSTPPTVSISSPTAGTSLSGTVSVSINASDNLSLASVQLKLDGSNLGPVLTGSGPSFSYSWNTSSASNGTHSLAAVATDSAGNSASSAPVSISVSNDSTPPTVAISSPAAGTTLSGSVSVAISASDNLSLASVQLKLDGSNLGPVLTGSGPSFSYSWNTISASNGPHSLTALATDSAGNSASSAPVSISVSNDSTPPTVSISSPAAGTTLSGSVSVAINASDSVSLATVQLKLDGSNLGPALTGPGPSFSYSWNTISATDGPHTLIAVATDSAGNSASSAPVSISVNNDITPPTVSISSPVSGVTLSGSVSVSINASDNVSVTSVQLKLDGSNLGPALTGSGPSFSYFWNTASVSNGSHSLTALATDSGGNSTTSAPVSFSVSNTGPQPLLLLSGEASELASSSNGALVSPSIAPPGFSGSLVKKANGSVTFSPAQSGNGVYFQSCCDNSNTAYYKFSGSSLANIFNVNQGQISFFLKSRFSFAQRQASASASRFAFDVRDADSNNHLFYFYTQVSSGYLLFSYRAGGTASQFYFTPKGTEDALFGNGSILKVSISWDGSTSKLFFNDTLVQSSSYTKAVPNWTSASNFDLGAYEYSSLGGYNVLDDIIDEFSVFGPPPSDVTPPTVSISSPAPGASLSGSVSVSVNASDNISLASVQLKLDGSNLGPALTGSGPSFSYSWNTASASNGSHSLTAVATDSAGNSASSSPVSVSISNIVPPPVISAVTALPISSTTATISWSTDTPADSQVAFGLALPYSSLSPLSTSLSTSHSLTLSSLSPSSLYHFQVLSRDSSGNLSSSSDFSFSTSAPPVGPQPLLLLSGEASELASSSNGALVSPSIAPPGFSGSLVKKANGSVTFSPAQSGNGVYFQSCCDNSNTAYYKFSGSSLANIFNVNQGQISFFLKSRFSFAQRQASASASRFAFDVRDADSNNHLFYFYTQVSSGYLLFSYRAGGTASQFYFTPKGTEDALFGNGSILKVSISWDGSTSKLFFNDTLVQSSSYTKAVPNWTSASNFDLGAYEYSSLGGYNVLDDIIDEFSVFGPPPSDVTPPTVSISSPAPGASLSGSASISINASDNISLASVQLKLDGSNLGPALTGSGPSFSYSWNTASASNGTHSLTAVATDSAGNSTSSSPVSVSVNHGIAP